MYLHNVSPRRKLWNELSSFGGTEKRDAGITSVQLSSQSDCTWKERATKHEFKAATKHNRHCKTQRGQLSLSFFFFLRLLKQQHCVLECARVRFESQPLTMAAATADVSGGTMQQTIGALWSARPTDGFHMKTSSRRFRARQGHNRALTGTQHGGK